MSLRLSKPCPERPELAALLKKAADWYAALSPIARHQHYKTQAKSWVIGEMMLDHPLMTRDEAERIYHEVTGEPLTREDQMNWQLIETAPCDGETILVSYRHKGTWIYRVAFCQEIEGDQRRWLTRPGEWHITPTHWMPLQSPSAP